MSVQRARGQAVSLPPYSPVLRRLFAFYLRRYFKRHFNAVRVAVNGAAPQPGERPLIIYSNHPSWWDPLVAFVIADVFYRERGAYGPMEAEALRKYPFFRRLGVFPVQPGGYRGAATFLRVAEAALARAGAILYVTAQGEFCDPRRRPVRLQPGLAHLMRRLPQAQAVPLAFEYPFWTERHPEALLRFGSPIFAEERSDFSVDQWNGALSSALEATMDALAVDAQQRDLAAFRVLIGGRVGVGGVYDAWRRLKAVVGGRRFEAAHGNMERKSSCRL